jgi:molecular chaperone GrpE
MTDSHGPAGTTAEPDGSVAAPEQQQAAEADQANALALEVSELKDRLLRSLAEMENLRRRTAREVADARAYGITSFARDILGVVDNMARALQALDAELREKADAGVKA